MAVLLQLSVSIFPSTYQQEGVEIFPVEVSLKGQFYSKKRDLTEIFPGKHSPALRF